MIGGHDFLETFIESFFEGTGKTLSPHLKLYRRGRSIYVRGMNYNLKVTFSFVQTIPDDAAERQ